MQYFFILITVPACEVVVACCMIFLRKKPGGLLGIGGMTSFYFHCLVHEGHSIFCSQHVCVFMAHAFHFHLGKKVRFLSNIAAFVMSPYSNASINPVSPLCGISVVGLSLHMTLRTDRWKVS